MNKTTRFESAASRESAAERTARIRARRAERPSYGPEETVRATEVRDGDFVVRIRPAGIYRGMTANGAVRAARPSTSCYVKGTFVPAIKLEWLDERFASVYLLPETPVVVRRIAR